MTEKIGAAIAKQDTGPGAMVKQYSGDFKMVLPEHIKPDTFVRLAQGVLRRDPKLAQAAQRNPGSFMAALLECARLGHDPGTPAFYLVPFGNEVQGVEGYRGIVDRIYRAGAVSAIKAELVYERDHYRFNPTTMNVPEFEPDDFAADRGDLIGAFAYAELKDGGTSRVVRINRTYIDKVKAESRGSNSSSSPWSKWFDQMVLKTVLRRLEAFVPSSTEYRREELRIAREVAAETAPQPSPVKPPVDVSGWAEVDDQGHVVDAELVDRSDEQTEIEAELNGGN